MSLANALAEGMNTYYDLDGPASPNGSPMDSTIHIDDSQPPPGQQSLLRLDGMLSNLPMDLYIEKLLDSCTDTGLSVLCYRDHLETKARLLQDCPDGDLIQRVGGKKQPRDLKLAKDCFLLWSFLNGESSSEVAHIFKKTLTSPSSQRQSTSSTPIRQLNQRCTQPSTANVQQTLTRQASLSHAECNSKITMLQENVLKLEADVDSCKSKISSLDKRLQDVSLKLADVENRPKPSSVSECSHKDNDSLSASLQAMTEKIAKINTEVASMKTSIDVLSIAKILENPKSIPLSSTAVTVPKSVWGPPTPTTTDPAKQSCTITQSAKTAGTSVRSQPNKDIHIVASKPGKTQGKSTCEINVNTTPSCNLEPVPSSSNSTSKNVWKKASQLNPQKENALDRMKLSSKPQESTTTLSHCSINSSDDDFRAVSRQRRTRSFHISRIDPNVSEQKVKQYLADKNITVTMFRFLNTTNTRSKTAKVNVDAHDAKHLSESTFWPEGIRCRQWLSNNRYYDEFGYDTYRYNQDQQESHYE
ncbi:unnamed protein product [Owenia fusiformis]|uniref:Uncharacterized protein n=1 Tax=Owenia fusiformis TaxID=6347 RepID=A0A8S4NL76_OWEFU|nr:unnamed protein product [Owenia fusiformis]